MSSNPTRSFDMRAFLESRDIEKKGVEYRRSEGIFSQGDASRTVMYIHTGGVRITARAKNGREIAIARLGPGDFFGEACMAGQARRKTSATALSLSMIVVLGKGEMLRLLRTDPRFAGRFITRTLTTNRRIQGNLIAQLFDHDEKRIARALLRRARYGCCGSTNGRWL